MEEQDPLPRVSRREVTKKIALSTAIGAGFTGAASAQDPEPEAFCQTTLSETTSPPCCYSHDVGGADYIIVSGNTTNGGTVDCWIETNTAECTVTSSEADYYREIDDAGFELRIDNPGDSISLTMAQPSDETEYHTFYFEIEQCTG